MIDSKRAIFLTLSPPNLKFDTFFDFQFPRIFVVTSSRYVSGLTLNRLVYNEFAGKSRNDLC